jgi:hypothetical protein
MPLRVVQSRAGSSGTTLVLGLLARAALPLRPVAPGTGTLSPTREKKRRCASGLAMTFTVLSAWVQTRILVWGRLWR